MNELHGELRAVARDVLAPCRPVLNGGSAAAPPWSQLAGLGWLGLEVPEALGGSGATFAETAVVLEELGRVAAAGPYLGCVLAVGALLAARPSPARDELLAGVADGSVRATVALPGASIDCGEPSFRLTGGGLTGEARFVVDAPAADVVLAVAEGPTLVAATPTEAAAASRPERARPRGDFAVGAAAVVDPSRSIGDVRADGAAVTDLGAIDPTALTERAALAIAVDSLGIAGAALDATVEHATDRHQFGRPIGSFQAVKHQAADVAVELAVSRRLVADGRVPMAKAHATETAVLAAGTALQLHGGIGYTWEHGIHVLLKRALLNRELFGSPPAHRARLARRYGAATKM